MSETPAPEPAEPAGKRPLPLAWILVAALAAVLLLVVGVLVGVLLGGAPQPSPTGAASPTPTRSASPTPTPTPTQTATAAPTPSPTPTTDPAPPPPPPPDPAVGQILSFGVQGDPEAGCVGNPQGTVTVTFAYDTRNAVEAGFGIDTADGISGPYFYPLDLPSGSFSLDQSCDNPQTYAFTVAGSDGVHHTEFIELFQ